MKSAVSKKYAKAVMSKFSNDELNELVDSMQIIASAFENQKFREIIASAVVKSIEKERLILDISGDISKDKRFVNFIKILSENNRLSLIPEIFLDLKSQMLAIKNEYVAEVYSNQELTEKDLKLLQEQFSKKFNAKINCEHKGSNLDGIRINIDGLGMEINLSFENLKTKMSDYILQAI